MRSPLAVTSLGIHGIAVTGLLIAGLWRLERLEPGRRSIDLAVATTPPPAASGSPAAARAEPFKKKQRRIPPEVVQPTKRDQAVKPATATEPGLGTGGTGSGAGSGSGSDPDGTGTCTSPPCGNDPKPAVAPPVAPQIVPPSVLKGLRVAGETMIVPPAPVKTAMLRDGITKAIATFKVCVTRTGEVSAVSVLKSSGYPGYDHVIDQGLRKWLYRPYQINGRAVPVCGTVTFIYTIH